jgi:hypothetical protein
MSRIGKIARLPSLIRDELNRRLDNSESGPKLLAWLNSQAEAQAVLVEHFDGRPITKQNLSEWRHGGFQDWLQFQQTRGWARSLFDESAALAQETGERSLADLLSAPLAVALGRRLSHAAHAAPDDPVHGPALFAVARELSWLRRSDHGERLLRLKRELWQAEHAKAEDKKVRDAAQAARDLGLTEEEAKELCAYYFRGLLRRTAPTDPAASNPQSAPSPDFPPQSPTQSK